MSLQIPPEHLANPELLTEAERWYIWTRTPSKYPKGLERPVAPETKERVAPGTKVTPLEQQSIPTIGEPGGIQDDTDEDYEEGWNNPQRRAELTRRGLSIDGKKDDLIGRLRRSDSQELLPDDYDKVNNTPPEPTEDSDDDSDGDDDEDDDAVNDDGDDEE